MSGIYCIFNLVNFKIYIGQSVNVKDRLAHHKSELRHNRHANSHLQRSWNKYGESCFLFKVLNICDECRLDELERQYIKGFDSINPNYGYNHETGGSLNKHPSEEVLRRASESHKGKMAGKNNPMFGKHIPCSESKKQRLSELFSGSGNPMYGVRVEKTPELRKHLSEIFSGEGNPFYGKKHSEETKKKLSDLKKSVQSDVLRQEKNLCRRMRPLEKLIFIQGLLRERQKRI